ncbi:MAG: 50S ribosomal protein L28 [Pseudomonadota bacterium]|nr:50S ribosomal protein L28 [Pseudomonadota bacterium]
MSKVCSITKKRPMSGNHVSHAKNHVKRRFMPNLQTKRFWDPVKKTYVKLVVSAKAIKLIDKIGFTAAMEKFNKK